MKNGDLVKSPDGWLGFVLKIDKDHYGANQAFKVVGAERGECIGPWSVNAILPTKQGIRDRVLILWTKDGDITYEESTNIEVISES